jgi:electron transport complex protein RnfA
MEAGGLFAVALAAALANNLMLSRLVGVCPFVGEPARLISLAGLGLGVAASMAMASVASAAIDRYVLVPLDLGFLRTAVLVLLVVVCATVAVAVARAGRRRFRDGPGRVLAGLVGNCATLAVPLLVVEMHYGAADALVFAVSSGLGLMLVLTILASLRRRMETGSVPESFKGLPIGLITSGLMALAFMGFLGVGGE